jgi:hypothetical protein
MDTDVMRIIDTFANDVGQLPAGSAPRSLIERTQAALRTALTVAAGHPYESAWMLFYHQAHRLIACLDDRSALPGLRAFLAENVDLHHEGRESARPAAVTRHA